MQNKSIKVEDIIELIKRRLRGFIISSLAVFLLSVLVILAWKPVYRSTATILIEEQEIPREYVTTIVSNYAEERLQTINQRIMSAQRLLEIVNRFNLYADKRNRLTTEEIIENMRKKDIKFETKMVDVVDRATGRPTEATIAFTVSYQGNDPALVQQVANVLSSLYLDENIKVIGQQTAGTTKFLEEEMKSVQAKLSGLERRIAAYKEKNPRALPELLQFNLQTMDWIERNHEQLNDELRTLREKESYIQTELAAVAPDTVNQDKDRLKELRVTLVRLTTRYSDEYPDVIKTKAEIAELEKKIQSREGRLEVLEKPDNPAYVALASQLASVQAEIKSANRQIEELDRKRDEYRQRLEMSPRVEEGYRNLMVERNNTQAKYDDLMKKFMEAKVASGLENRQMGERFTLIDPARLPEKPVAPNRPVILMIGLILGLGSGVLTASVQESADLSARCAEDLSVFSPLPVLASLPEIVTSEDKSLRRKRLKAAAGTIVIASVVLVTVIHFFVIDLDVLWARILRHLAW